MSPERHWANTQSTEHAVVPYAIHHHAASHAASRHPGDLVVEWPPPRLVLGSSFGGDAADEEESEHAVALALASRVTVSIAEHNTALLLTH